MAKPVNYHFGNFPPGGLNWEELLPLVGPAAAAVARYDGTLTAIPNASFLLGPMTTQEAVLSSRIEGTQATMGEVLEFEADGDSEKISEGKRNDIQEILNYRMALRHSEHLPNSLPLCQRVICEAHKILMSGVRGHGKSPGQYRKIPNWIGPEGHPIERANYVPISAEKLPEAMGEWEKFAHSEFPDRLVQLAVLHAEFESLHPFLDGNGRIGRMFVPLFMWQNELIHAPMFYISAYLEARRDEYIERLRAVSRDGDWTGWCAFFLMALKSQAEENQNKAKEILHLYETMKPKVTELTHSQYAIQALDWMFNRPIFRSSDFVGNSGIPEPTAKRILVVLRKNDVLKTMIERKGSRSARLAFPELLNIAEGRTAF